MKTALRIGILLVSLVWGSSYSSSAVGQTKLPVPMSSLCLRCPQEIHPGKAPTDKVGLDGVYIQISATPAKAGDMRFHVVIDARGDKRVEETLRLLRVVTTSAGMLSAFEPIPGSPKIKRTRKGDTITADFTVPQKMIDNPDLALYFSSTCMEGCPAFYARLTGFTPDSPAESRSK